MSFENFPTNFNCDSRLSKGRPRQRRRHLRHPRRHPRHLRRHPRHRRRHPRHRRRSLRHPLRLYVEVFVTIFGIHYLDPFEILRAKVPGMIIYELICMSLSMVIRPDAYPFSILRRNPL